MKSVNGSQPGIKPEIKKWIKQLKDTYLDRFTFIYTLIAYTASTSVKTKSLETEAQAQAVLQSINNQANKTSVSLGENQEKVLAVLQSVIDREKQVTDSLKENREKVRAALQYITDSQNKVTESLEKIQNEAEQILSNMRKTAAEVGVSKQAEYFQNEAAFHQKQAKAWRWSVIALTCLLALLAAASLFLHKAPIISPQNTSEWVQLVASKIILFVVIGYILALSAKNFLSHQHNAVVNKHRQNALCTYNALVDAAKEPDDKAIILTHASACIFSPQDTGYTKVTSSNTQMANMPLVDLARRATHRVAPTTG